MSEHSAYRDCFSKYRNNLLGMKYLQQCNYVCTILSKRNYKMHSFNLTLNFFGGYLVISPVSTVSKINNENLFCDWIGKDVSSFSILRISLKLVCLCSTEYTHSDSGLGHDIVFYCQCLPVFWRNMLPKSSGLKLGNGGSMCLQNTCVHW